MDIKFKRKGKYFKNKNLNLLLEMYCNMVTNISAPCNNQVTDLSSGAAPEMKEQDILVICESRVDSIRKIDSKDRGAQIYEIHTF